MHGAEEPLASFQEILGTSPALTRMLKQAMSIARGDGPVLIFGEPGSGKESIARAIHRISPRRHESFVKVSCSAATGTLENQIFGHQIGASIDSAGFRPGRAGPAGLDLANNGVLLLDEIALAPLPLQSKLLSILDRGEFERIGNPRSVHVNVRLMATTTQDLKARVAAQLFRKDLYHRLNESSIHVPPLRERREDIPLLALYFMRKFAQRRDKNLKHIPEDTMRFLTEADWPGNVRQLEVLIQRAVALTDGPALQLPNFGDDQEDQVVNA